MSEPYIGQINLFAFGITPRYYAQCNGQILPINQNTALFALLGTYYGGNGVNTFALPNLQSMVAVGTVSQTPGVVSGSETIALTTSQIPTHNHVLQASTDAGDAYSPTNTEVLGQSNTLFNDKSTPVLNIYGPSPGNTTLSPSAVGPSGGSQGHSNIMPYLALNYCIALSGIFPSRN